MQPQSQIAESAPADFHILRVGYHDRVNLLPLLFPLKAGWVGAGAPWKLEVMDLPPSELVRALLQGELDAAFIPPLTLTQRGDELALLGGWGLASEGVTETALLLAPQRLDLMHEGELAVEAEAIGSTAEHLLRMLLKPYYDIALTFRMPDNPQFSQTAARLMYGDRAAAIAAKRQEGWVAEDLGVASYVMSGQPTVWEMLAARRDLEGHKPGAGAAIQAALKASQRAAQEQQATIVDEASRRLGLETRRVKELFARQRYTLGEKEQKGLAHYFTLAAQAGMNAGR